MQHLVSLVIVVGLALAPPTSEELVRLGEGLAARGDGKKAVPHLEKALADQTLPPPLRARAERAIGHALLQQKKPKDAAVHLKAATGLNAGDEKAWVLLGVAFDAAGDFAASLDAYRAGSVANPKSATLRHELGMALLEAGNNEEGARALVEGTALAPEDPELATDAAYALTVAGKWREAREQALRAAELSPESADAFYNLGMAESGLENKKAAREALRRAVERDEMHVPALLQLGFVESAMGDDMNASKRFTRVLQVEPENPRARAGLGASLGKLGTDDKKAKELLLAVVQAEPKSVMAHVLLGEIAAREGNLDEAIQRFEKARKLVGDATADGAALKARVEELRQKAREQKTQGKKG